MVEAVRCKACGVATEAEYTIVAGRRWYRCPHRWWVTESVDGDDGPHFCCSDRCVEVLADDDEKSGGSGW